MKTKQIIIYKQLYVYINLVNSCRGIPGKLQEENEQQARATQWRE